MRAILGALWLTGCGGDFNFGRQPDPTEQVEGAAVMELSAEELVYLDMEVGRAQSQVLMLTNAGPDNSLAISTISIESDELDAFYIDVDAHQDLEIPPGEEHEIVVVCDLPEATAVEASLQIVSNDGERPTLFVALTGEPLVGDTGGG
jgi:hypothetical protein